jgi:hypothetical protein
VKQDIEDGFNRDPTSATGIRNNPTRSPIIATQNGPQKSCLKTLAPELGVSDHCEHAENMFRLQERRSPNCTTRGKEDRYFGCIQNRFSQYEEKEKIYITLTRLPASEDDQKGNQSLHCQSGIYQVTHLLCKYIEANCQPATLKTASGSSFTMRDIRRRTEEFLHRKWHTKTRMGASSLAAHD